MLDFALQKTWPGDRHTAGFSLDAALRCAAARLVLFGASGSGKTLTLQLLAGLVRPDGGHIVVDGVTLYDAARKLDVPVQQRRMGYVFQDYALFPHLTVRQNVAFALRHRVAGALAGSGRDAVREADAMLERLEIAALANRYPHQISGGQRQRTALARALLSAPRLLLLDEPFAALDPLLRIRMRREMRDILACYGVPLVLITHDPEDVDAFAQTLAVYREGCIVSVLEDYPATRAAAPDAFTLLTSLSEHPAESDTAS